MTPSLHVSWQMSDPPLRAQSWYLWQSAEIAAQQANTALPASLPSGWPPVVMAILELAFTKKLNRHSGWDVSQVSDPSLLQALGVAAAIYKRGVPIKGKPAQELQGAYDIELSPADSTGVGKGSGGHKALPMLGGDENGFHIVDAGLARHWPELKKKAHFIWEADERHKTLAAVAAFEDAWRLAGQPRPWVIWGGGVLGDAAAFAASLCGAPFILVPTTLLAMVDACVGGKTGVNAPPFGKNQLGRFAFPKRVVIHPAFLGSLDQRQMAAGITECLKHVFLCGDHAMLAAMSRPYQAEDWRELRLLLLSLINVKASIVTEDPSEQGKRILLNLGHTLAHALEAVSHKRRSAEDSILLHGEAVGIGLQFALLLSRQYGGLSQEDCKRCVAALRKAQCLLARPVLEGYLGASLDEPQLWDELWTYMLQDKKQNDPSEAVTWVLLTEFGMAAKSEKPQSFTRQLRKDEVWPVWVDLLKQLK